jgi:multicomponent Na+:H+ antiporter subunit A
VQPGSLPHYLVVVIVTVLALPGVALVAGGVRWPADAVSANTPLQAVAGIGIVAAAVCAATLGHRMSAVLALGAVGFGVAVLFVIEGGPDLALTQLLVETVALVAFVLVLRQLPARYPNPPLPARFAMLRQIGRVVLSVAFGLAVFGFAVSATAVRKTEADGAEVLRRVLPDGKGANAVNVILSDFRALDTLGEITVVAVAVIGVLALGAAGGWQGRRVPIDATGGADR